ncbi:hypothetical protein V493_00955 [Pseudogymnoascus sp. VKM F-4281 (FW-2241)]|nr:hypothetical protein V493_00955 [Pseudogymnoascus sp. VKM F-4281 (FW-2241)]
MPQPSPCSLLQQLQTPLPSSPLAPGGRLRPLLAKPLVEVGQGQPVAGVDHLEPPCATAGATLAGLEPRDLAGLEELEDKEDARLLEESATYEVNGRLCVDDDETTA